MKRLFIALSLLLLIVSCSDDIKSNENNHIDIATVENPTLNSKFYFILDNGERMSTTTLDYRPKDGQRIIANYSFINSGSDANSVLKNVVRLNDVYEVLTKGILKIKPKQQDSIGNNQIEIKSIWVGSNYLNVEFVYPGLNKTHYINLVSDSTKTYPDNKIHLEFRHNANSDNLSYSKWGMASFDLRPLKAHVTSGDSINLVIHTREYISSIDKTYPLTYKFKTLTGMLFTTKITVPKDSNSKIR